MEFKAIPPVILSFELVVAFVLALYLLHRYGNIRRQNPFVTVSTLTVWFLSFAIIVLLPIDVSSAFYRSCLKRTITSDDPLDAINSTIDDSCNQYYCHGLIPDNTTLNNLTATCNNIGCYKPYSFICSQPLCILWFIIYWLFFLLSWIVLPLAQSYVLAGYFSVWKKLLRALIENAIFYVTLMVIVIVLLIYVVVIKKLFAFGQLPYIIATASNTWGLFILAILLGYGLVEVPRGLFLSSMTKYTLNHCYFRAAKLYIDMAECNEDLHEITERVIKLSQAVHYNDPLRKYVTQIISKFPSDLQDKFSKGHDDFEDFAPSEDTLTKSSLESLYKKVTKTARLSNSVKVMWSVLTDQALDLEDIESNQSLSRRSFVSSVRPKPSRSSPLSVLEWYWKILLRPWVLRIIAVCLGFLSVCIIWSEVLFSVTSPKLSVFAFLVYLGHRLSNYVAIELLSIIVVAYLSICAYYTVFKIRLFNLYNLAPRHSTDEYSLLFSAVILSRLALPICLNYLYMIQVVGLKTQDDEQEVLTAFSFATGNTDLIPWLTNYFYYCYPILIVLVCISTLFCLGSRLVSLLGYQKFIGEDDFSADYIDEGKALIKRERRLREKSIRECGKVRVNDIHDQRVDEILKDRTNEQRRNKPRRHDDNDDDNNINRLWSKAKGFAASKKKSTMPVRYSKNEEDGVELLKAERNNTKRDSYRTRIAPSPKTGIFDDI